MKMPVILLFALLPAALLGQTESIVIEWDKDHGTLFFPHALYEDGENTLPYFTRKTAWDHEGMLPVVRVHVKEALLLTGDELPPGAPVNHLEQAPLLEYALVREAKRSCVTLKLLPFFINESGGIERVNSFEIEYGMERALAPLKSHRKGSWSGHSVLATGDWYRVSVEQSGMHRLTYEQLKEIGIQNPAAVRIYGTGARLLPEKFSEGYTDDLSPVPVYMEKGNDGIFGPGDHLLFYAEGPVSWNYSDQEGLFIHHLHDYSWKGYYFLTDSQGPAAAPGEATLSTEVPTHVVSRYDFRDCFEEETYNLLNSGREWYGDIFSVNLEYLYPFRLPGHVINDSLKLRVTVAARSGVTSRFLVSADNHYLGNIELRGTNLSVYTAQYAYEGTGIFSMVPGSSDVTVALEYDRPDSNSEGWLNSMTINGRCELAMSGEDEFLFRESRSAGPGNVSEFHLALTGEPVIWDITDPSWPMNVPYTRSASEAVFTLETSGIREFIAFLPDGTFPTPGYSGEGLGAIENQDLHGLQNPDMIIIAPEEFLEPARQLAGYRESSDNLEVAVVLQQQVFNEFSSGTPDVTAIRNFMKMFYDRSGGSDDYCRYLLLFGDGSYANRNGPGKKNNPNRILTYQSSNSLSPTSSYISDDFFGMLDTDEGMANGLLDLGIGRLPASTVEEAEVLVEKITAYNEVANQGNWRNQLCFIGDDEDLNRHMEQADELASYVKDHYPAYNINKIYLDAFPQEKGATGFRYPEVNRAINDQVNRGALIVNYTGHGGQAGLAHEQVVTKNDINSWKNGEALPLFMTATCEFSRYDEYDYTQDQEVTSAGEEVLLNTRGGGIGLFTTTRLVYSGPNHALNEWFYQRVFEKDENYENYRLGDIIAFSKNSTGPEINKLNFTLLGDPSMRLAYPRHRVVTDSINGMDIHLLEDTLSAFEWVTVSGHLETQEGTFLDSYNGTVSPMVFDKEKNVETLSNDNDPKYQYKARNSILYSGTATVSNGRFTFGFFVPKDINYSYGKGKISYYSQNSVVDANGSCDQFSVGGIGKENALDPEAPEIMLYLNDTFFISGGVTDPSPTLLVHARDNFGINTTGNGIGHDLTATLDGDRVNAVILNELFQANRDSYNSGTIRYPYAGLEEGRHEITVKIWDIHNNSTESTIEFLVVDSQEMILEQLYNYPNPFTGQTWFNISHNRPDHEMRLVLTIYDLSGQVVRVIDRQVYSGGYRLEPILWDGTSSGGSRLGGGIYIYRATLSTGQGEAATESGKLVLLR
jgi:hypothetical protein